MRSHRPRRWALLGAALLATGAMTAPVEAQTPTPSRPTLRPPQPTRAEKVPFLSYLAVVVVIAAPIAVNFISSKRGHQD